MGRQPDVADKDVDLLPGQSLKDTAGIANFQNFIGAEIHEACCG